MATVEVVISADENVISYKGENFYRSCGHVVMKKPDSISSCVKRKNHPTNIHEDWDGNVKIGEHG